MGPIICDVAGLELSSEDKVILEHPLVGGVILFSRNYESIEQLKNLVVQLREVRPEMLISVDQEGGRVQRFKKEFTLLPALGTIGKLLDSGALEKDKVLQYAEHLGHLMAIEIQHMGIDISFAPVIDCDKGLSQIIGDRAFHSDPQVVAELAKAYIIGMGKGNMGATLKHFPGHGGVIPDSHEELPIDSRSLAEIKEDMYPFKVLIQSSIPNIRALMPAHIIFEAVDTLPVGFSNIWLQKILREELGFTGAIISDDLSMKATLYLGDMSARAQLALEAGCDAILICNDRVAVEGVLDTLRDTRPKESGLRLEALQTARVEIELKSQSS
jgi:beta-N-acetylhexosaminidase